MEDPGMVQNWSFWGSKYPILALFVIFVDISGLEMDRKWVDFGHAFERLLSKKDHAKQDPVLDPIWDPLLERSRFGL